MSGRNARAGEPGKGLTTSGSGETVSGHAELTKPTGGLIIKLSLDVRCHCAEPGSHFSMDSPCSYTKTDTYGGPEGACR